MIVKGKVWKFGDNVNTDQIIPWKYKSKTIDPEELGRYAMEGIRPNFSSMISKGDIIVAGENFGCGSSREQAPLAIKYSGISAVVAKSFARIFLRNSINIGLPIVECPDLYQYVAEGDVIEIDFEKGSINVKGREFSFKPFPPFLQKILKSGGLVQYYRKYIAKK